MLYRIVGIRGDAVVAKDAENVRPQSAVSGKAMRHKDLNLTVR